MTALRRACDIDAEIMRVRAQMLGADEAGDETAVAAAGLQLDELLDERLHIPLQQQRPVA